MEIFFHVHTSFSITSSVNQVCLSYHQDKIGYSFENWAKIEEKTSFSNFLNLFFHHHMKHDALSFMLTWDCKCTLNHHWKLMPRCIYVPVAFCVMIKMLKICMTKSEQVRENHARKIFDNIFAWQFLMSNQVHWTFDQNIATGQRAWNTE